MDNTNGKPEVDTPKIVVGVTGRAGTGKSTFSRMLADKGAELIDADSIAWELYQKPDIHADLKRIFTEKIFKDGNTLDRKLLGDIVFNDPKALNELNAVLHPPLVKELVRRIESSAKRLVIIDAALLLDWSLAKHCDIVIAVVTTEDTSISRLKAKGMDSDRAEAILASQRPENEFRELSDVVIENNGSLETLRLEADKVWQNQLQPLLNNAR